MLNIRGLENQENLPDGVQVDILAPCIEYFNNIVTNDQAKFIIDVCERMDSEKNENWQFKDARVGNEKLLNQLVRSNKTMKLNFAAFNNKNNMERLERQKIALVNDIQNIIQNAVGHAVRYYTFKYNFSIEADEGFTLLKYKTGTEYKPHTDNGIGKPFSDRTLSMVMYLNPTEYTGGETYFNNFDISVKPVNPGLVLFPSNYAYIHQAKPVKTGTKYAIVTWLRMPFEYKK